MQESERPARGARILDLIASTEVLAKRLNGEDATELRRIVKSCTTQAKPLPSNLTVVQRQALASLKKDSSIVILRADKGNASVVLDSSIYHEKINKVLSDKAKYSPLNTDPTSKLERRLAKTLSQLQNKGEPIVDTIGRRGIPSLCTFGKPYSCGAWLCDGVSQRLYSRSSSPLFCN